MDKKLSAQFLLRIFIIVFVTAGALIILGQFGFEVQSTRNFWINIPFAIYICSPAIASYLVLKKNGKVSSFREWLKNIFNFRCKIHHYVFVLLGIVLYFAIHIIAAGGIEEGGLYILPDVRLTNPILIFLMSLPVTLAIGGMEEAGWMYILQPEVSKKYGLVLSSVFVGMVWVVWHIPLFFIPGTVHHAGLESFLMFAFSNIFGRFYFGAIHKISGSVFLCILFHTMYNAGYNAFIFTSTWSGHIIALAVLFIISIVAVRMHNKRIQQME